MHVHVPQASPAPSPSVSVWSFDFDGQLSQELGVLHISPRTHTGPSPDLNLRGSLTDQGRVQLAHPTRATRATRAITQQTTTRCTTAQSHHHHHHQHSARASLTRHHPYRVLCTWTPLCTCSHPRRWWSQTDILCTPQHPPCCTALLHTPRTPRCHRARTYLAHTACTHPRVRERTHRLGRKPHRTPDPSHQAHTAHTLSRPGRWSGPRGSPRRRWSPRCLRTSRLGTWCMHHLGHH